MQSWTLCYDLQYEHASTRYSASLSGFVAGISPTGLSPLQQMTTKGNTENMCKNSASREYLRRQRQRPSSWGRCAPGSSATILALAVMCLSVFSKASSAGILDPLYNSVWPWHLHVSYAVDTGNRTTVNAPQLSFSFALTKLYLIGSNDLTWELYYKENQSFYMSASNISSMWVISILPYLAVRCSSVTARQGFTCYLVLAQSVFASRASRWHELLVSFVWH